MLEISIYIVELNHIFVCEMELVFLHSIVVNMCYFEKKIYYLLKFQSFEER